MLEFKIPRKNFFEFFATLRASEDMEKNKYILLIVNLTNDTLQKEISAYLLDE